MFLRLLNTRIQGYLHLKISLPPVLKAGSSGNVKLEFKKNSNLGQKIPLFIHYKIYHGTEGQKIRKKILGGYI